MTKFASTSGITAAPIGLGEAVRLDYSRSSSVRTELGSGAANAGLSLPPDGDRAVGAAL
jgi:hypothetical protein